SSTISENPGSQGTTNRLGKAGGIHFPPNAQYGIYEAPIPGHPANPHLPYNASVTATLTIPLADSDFPKRIAPAHFFSSNINIPDPKHLTCRRDILLSAEGHRQIYADAIPYWWDGRKIVVPFGRTSIFYFGDVAVFFCNMSRSKSLSPRANRYYSV